MDSNEWVTPLAGPVLPEVKRMKASAVGSGCDRVAFTGAAATRASKLGRRSSVAPRGQRLDAVCVDDREERRIGQEPIGEAPVHCQEAQQTRALRELAEQRGVVAFQPPIERSERATLQREVVIGDPHCKIIRDLSADYELTLKCSTSKMVTNLNMPLTIIIPDEKSESAIEIESNNNNNNNNNTNNHNNYNNYNNYNNNNNNNNTTNSDMDLYTPLRSPPSFNSSYS